MRNHTYWGAFWLGIGLVGMLDGIVFHQLLQWHSVLMHTDRYHQIVSDGVFHLAVTVTVVIGAALLWASNPAGEHHSAIRLWSGLLTGAGLFNLVEGLVNHHLLRIHRVRPGPHELYYDLAYDAAALAMLAAGLLLYRRSAHAAATRKSRSSG